MNIVRNTGFMAVVAVAALAAGCCKEKGAQACADAAPEAAAAVEKPVPQAAAAPEAAEEPAEPAVVFDDDEMIVEAYGKTLTYGEAIGTVRRAMKAQGVPEAQLDQVVGQVAPRALPQIAEQFVMMNALQGEAAKLGVTCTEEDVEAEFAKAVSGLPPGVSLDEALERSGITAEDLKKQIREQLPISKMVDILTQGLEVTGEEIAKFYEENGGAFESPEQVRAAHILVLADKGDDAKDAEALEKIKAIRERAIAGEDFAALAKECSEDPGSKDNGGEYTFGRGRMVPEFEKAAFEQELGIVGEPVRTSYGYHILKVLERMEAGKKPLEEVSDDIKSHLEDQKKGEIVGKYVKSIRAGLVFSANEKIGPIFVEEDEEEFGAAAKPCSCADCKDPDCDKADCECDEPAPEAKAAVETDAAPAPAAAEPAPASAE